MNLVCYEMNRDTNKLEKENTMPRGFKKAVAPSAALEAAKAVARSIDAGNVVHAGGLNPNAMTPFDAKQDSIFDHVAEQNLIAANSFPVAADPVAPELEKSATIVSLERTEQSQSEQPILGGSKADTFKRLATARVNKALKFIDLVKNLSNRSVYEYAPEQVETILKALRAQVDSLEQSFIQSEKKAPTISL